MFTRIRILTSCLGIIGVGTLIAFPASSQLTPINPLTPLNPINPLTPINRGNTINRSNSNPSPTLLNRPVIQVNPGIQNRYGTTSSYPYGSRVNELGAITTPSGQVIYPNGGTNNGDDTTTYYYPDGARITIDKTKLPGNGGFLR